MTYGTDYSNQETQQFVSAVFRNQLQPSSERTELLTGPAKSPESVFPDKLLDIGRDLVGICGYLRNEYITGTTQNRIYDIAGYSKCYSVFWTFLQKFRHLELVVNLLR